ncbi:MAG: hypothetical protein P8L66_02745 [Rhodospirillaceae bacterium]|nr:hypothetical protein [Rhodospirillaceae bacterium]
MLKWIKRIAVTLVVLIVVVGGGGYGTFTYMNRTPPQLVEPNYFRIYKEQLASEEAMTPEGNVAIFMSGLIMPEDFRVPDFHNLALKSSQYIPWPIRNRAMADPGVILLDTERFYEFEEFVPTNLVDAYGSSMDVDGTPWVEKYHNGDLIWVDPSPTQHFDHGYFLYTARKGGMPGPSQKLVNKARVYYYGKGKGFMNGKVPHEAGNWAIVEATMEKITAKYGDVPYRWVTAEDFHLARKAMFELLDCGADTIIFASPRPVYSHHEEFNGSIKHAMHYIHEWEEANDKHIKTIMTQNLANFPIVHETYAIMLRDRLDQLPRGSGVKVVASVHGMAWDLVPNEAWIELSPDYIDPIMEKLNSVVAEYDFGRTQVVQSQDHFADPHNNPNGTYLSTNKAFWNGIEDGYDYVINLPIEFFAENTDTMFSHAMYNYEGFPGFNIYDPVDYSDWTMPYTKTFDIEGTKVIYNGLPVGKYNKPIVEAYFQAMDAILARSLTPLGAKGDVALAN